MNMPHIWLRAETKPNEARTPLTPEGARSLLDKGFAVTVEVDRDRVFPIDHYRAAGCDTADGGSWIDAPSDAFILGLKELADEDFELQHRHIHFAHVFKGQSGANNMLGRFTAGGGRLYDLEYLVDEAGRRIAAFGYWAGYCGAALGVLAFANKAAGAARPLAALDSYAGKDELLDSVRTSLAKSDAQPRILVIGARGRSGTGAVELGQTLGLEVIEWDLQETQKGGPFAEINSVDVFVNCVFVASDLPPFVTTDSLSAPGRDLSVITDVSCDPYGDYNPLPIYRQITTFDDPTLRIKVGEPPLHLIAIDHLPSLLPRESSEDYGGQLLPFLATLDRPDEGVWGRANAVYLDKTRALIEP
ncbi:MAG: saccharopine dehydrogenase [Pseudomonadota bacterium]